ncbi:MAG: sodium-translocating pyrophosphatase [Oscillospiraceae bacterium]|nr:sodium-translocating pyrophosphatase [Oscillospiraceae bacterium]
MGAIIATIAATSLTAMASEADVSVPEFHGVQRNLLLIGIGVCVLGLIFGVAQFLRIRKLKAHRSMLDVAATIYETCKAYLVQQGKFLLMLFVIVGLIVGFYFGGLKHNSVGSVALILLWMILGIAGSYVISWYGMRVNTLANARMAFASLERKPLKLLNIPLDAGMSIGVLLVCVELLMMLIILLFIPRELAGACFIGFAVGESLGASALRICGGIFTKIADIGSDLMKIFFKIKEDDPRNPGVIADCTGDNAGDSVGPTADGFETYGVTGVALVTFTCLAVAPAHQAAVLTWIFTMRILMVVTSVISFYINKAYATARFSGDSREFDFESPLTSLVWITSVVSIVVTFVASYLLIGPASEIGAAGANLWWKLAAIISCGTLGAALIPEFTKLFTSSKSAHCQEAVASARQGGASLNILSGLVAGNFSAFWKGVVFALLMFLALIFGKEGLDTVMLEGYGGYTAILAFGLVAFGFLSMGPVTIAVDSYGPVTDNAQSIYELSLIDEIPDIENEIGRDFGFKPDMEVAKHYLEANDSAGNTFKATSKPVLIGTAVVGATIMIFSLILVIAKTTGLSIDSFTSLLNPYTIIGFLCGGAVIYWFSGASIQAVVAGAFNAVEYIKDNIELDENASSRAATEKSKEVVNICTRFSQKGMTNIFIAIFCFALAFAFFSAPSGDSINVGFFIAYLFGLAFFGLFQAIFMANAGGCWDNAKKVVEVDLHDKDSELHDAVVVGDTVGDPYKDTSSVSLNPIIKFSTLFGTLAMEIALTEQFRSSARYIGVVLLAVALVFVWRSFYKMRIGNLKESLKDSKKQ